MRKAILLGLAAALGLCAQQQRQYEAYTYDGSGNRYGGRVYGETRRPGELSRTERVVSVNGRAVPLEQVEEKVILDTPGHKVVERIIRRYSQDGRPAGMEKVRIEERRDPTGKRTTVSTVYDGDVNGRFRLRERQVTEAVTKGKTLEAITRVERPSVNGSLKVVERRQMRQVERDNGLSREVTIYRPADGRFAPAAKEVTEIVRQGNRETAVTTRYNTVTADGRMGFAGKTVKEIVRRADGAERQVISIYGASAPGRPISEGGREHLREQILVEKQVQADGSVVERTGVRRVSLSDPNRLEAYQPVSEVICRGDCLPPPPQPKAEKAGQQAAQAGEQEQQEQPQTSETAREQPTVVIRDVVPPSPARPQPGAGPGAQPAGQPAQQGTPAARPGRQPAPQPAAKPPRRSEPVPDDRPDPKRGPGS